MEGVEQYPTFVYVAYITPNGIRWAVPQERVTFDGILGA